MVIQKAMLEQPSILKEQTRVHPVWNFFRAHLTQSLKEDVFNDGCSNWNEEHHYDKSSKE
jgi:hypothetical protein